MMIQNCPKQANRNPLPTSVGGMSRSACSLFFAIALWNSGAFAQGIHNPAAHYFSFADSPFAGVPFSFFYVETFEDGLLNTPGVTAVGGLVLLRSDQFSDSVDADDGVIDNNGNTGGAKTGAFYSAGLTTLEFNFDPVLLGGLLPTHAGLVVTDSLQSTAVTLTAYRAGFKLGSVSGFQVAEQLHFTQQDRFYGFYDRRGIDRIVLYLGGDSDWAMDHLQYGHASCPCDLNGDGLVDDSDFTIFIGPYNLLDCADPAMPHSCPADFNDDGSVDDSDFVVFVTAYNELICT